MNYIPYSACPDCGGDLGEIDVISQSTGQLALRFGYSLAKAANPSLETRFSDQGELKFYMCSNCRRVILAAKPAE